MVGKKMLRKWIDFNRYILRKEHFEMRNPVLHRRYYLAKNQSLCRLRLKVSTRPSRENFAICSFFTVHTFFHFTNLTNISRGWNMQCQLTGSDRKSILATLQQIVICTIALCEGILLYYIRFTYSVSFN